MPSTLRCRPGIALARCRRWASDRSRMSLTSVDLPEPETPVTAIGTRAGRTTSMSLGCAPGAAHRHHVAGAGRRRAGTGIDFLPTGTAR